MNHTFNSSYQQWGSPTTSNNNNNNNTMKVDPVLPNPYSPPQPPQQVVYPGFAPLPQQGSTYNAATHAFIAPPANNNVPNNAYYANPPGNNNNAFPAANDYF